MRAIAVACMLTSATTFLGLLPLILDRSIQAQFLIPMAVSLAFGIIFSTGITLYLIPCASAALPPLHRMERGLGGEVVAHTTIYNATTCILASYN